MDQHYRLNQPPRWFTAAVTTPPAALALGFVILPIGMLVAQAVTFEALTTTLSEARTWEVVGFTTVQAIISTIVTLALGLLPGLVIARSDFRGRQFVLSLFAAVFVMPTVVMAAGVRALLPGEPSGLVPIVVAHTLFNLAIVIRGVAAAPVPVDLEHAASALGARRGDITRTITLPLLRPTLIGLTAVVFALCFTSFGIVRILGTTDSTTLEVEIWRETIILGRIDRGIVLALAQLFTLVVGLGVWLIIRSRSTPHQHGSRQPISRHGLAIVTASCLLVLAPLIALVRGSFLVNNTLSLSGWRNLFSNSIRPGLRLGFDPVQAALTSLTTATVATTFALIVAAFVVTATASSTSIGRIVDGAAMIPLGVSAVTLGLGLLITFDVPPFDWRASSMMTPLGHALIATPFVIRPAIGALSTLDERQAHAAGTLGAAPIRALFSSVIPVVAVPLLSGAGFAIAISLGEFGATSMLSRSGGETLPIIIERLLSRTGGDFRARAYGLSIILASATMGMVIALDSAANRSRR